MGTGIAFAFAALGSLVIEHSRPEETGVASGMNTIMRTVGRRLRRPDRRRGDLREHAGGTSIPLERGFTIAFAIGACGAVVALLPTLLLRDGRPSRPAVASGTA